MKEVRTHSSCHFFHLRSDLNSPAVHSMTLIVSSDVSVVFDLGFPLSRRLSGELEGAR